MTDNTTPKRIIPLALVSPLPAEGPSQDGRQPRKRKRVADMTSEEKAQKQLKRKIRNRVASQNTRDKRKQYVTDLELQVKKLQAQNEALEKENLLLKQRSGSLLLANSQLTGSEVVLASGKQLGGGVSTRSAVFGVVSRQKKPQTPALLSATLMQLLTILSVTYCHCCWDTQRKAVVPPVSQKHFQARTSFLRYHTHRRRRVILRLQKWWGARQAQWNPPRNWNPNQAWHHTTKSTQICLHLYLMNTSWMTLWIHAVYTHRWPILIKTGTLTGHQCWLTCVM